MLLLFFPLSWLRVLEQGYREQVWYQSKIADVLVRSMHRGLKLDGAIGQGEICNSLKSEKFSKSLLSHIGKNKIKF